MAWRLWSKLPWYRCKGWTTEPKIWNFKTNYGWIWEKKLCEYQLRIISINRKQIKFSETQGSKISAKHYKEHYECGYIFIGWG